MPADKDNRDERLKKDVLGAAISKELGYNQEKWNNPDKPLSRSEYDEIGQVSVRSIQNQFSSDDRKGDGWNRLKEKIGLEINLSGEKEYTDEEIKKDVLGAAMAKNLGYNGPWENPDKPLSRSEYIEIGLVSEYPIQGRFSSNDRKADGWNNLKEELGLKISSTSEYSEEEIKKIKKDVLGAAMAKNLGYNGPWENPDKPLFQEEYNEVGKASISYICRKFSSESRNRDGWNNLKEELGLKISSTSEYSEEEIKKDVLGAIMAKDLGYKEEAWKSDGPLLLEEYGKVGKVSEGTIRDRFGSEGSQSSWRGLRSEVEKEALERQGHDGEDLLPSEEGRDEEIMEELTSSPDEEDVPDWMEP